MNLHDAHHPARRLECCAEEANVLARARLGTAGNSRRIINKHNIQPSTNAACKNATNDDCRIVAFYAPTAFCAVNISKASQKTVECFPYLFFCGLYRRRRCLGRHWCDKWSRILTSRGCSSCHAIDRLCLPVAGCDAILHLAKLVCGNLVAPCRLCLGLLGFCLRFIIPRRQFSKSQAAHTRRKNNHQKFFHHHCLQVEAGRTGTPTLVAPSCVLTRGTLPFSMS